MSVCCQHDHNDRHSHAETIWHEILHHLPYAIFAVALSMILLTTMGYGTVYEHQLGGLYDLFHSLHFLHLVFAGTGTVIAFRKHSKNLLATLLLGLIVPTIFCTLSDTIMPYFGGVMLGVPMYFHWCFVDHQATVFVFLLVGVLNGLIIGSQREATQMFSSVSVHFAHIFVSAFASTVYLISQGFYHWSASMGYVFAYLILAVVLPCTIADVVVPTWFGLWAARRVTKKGIVKNEKHTS